MVTNGLPYKQMIVEKLIRVHQDDPALGDWCVAEKEINLWVDASSLAMGMILENYGIYQEDAYWLQPINDAQHINLAELDATMKGINLVLVVGQGGAPVHWLGIHVSMAEQPDRQNLSEDENCEQDPGAQEIGKLVATNWGVLAGSLSNWPCRRRIWLIN